MKYLALPLLLMLLFFSGCDLLDDDDDDSSDGGTEMVASESSSSTVVLEAFSDFSCSSSWTNRDGALGLTARTGSGTCKASFPGSSGTYRITITVQTEFDGNSPYALYINDAGAASGQYPLSYDCGCEPDDWRSECPDKNVDLDAGTHNVATGDVIKFYGEEDWNCDDHGAYAKWHKITFTRI